MRLKILLGTGLVLAGGALAAWLLLPIAGGPGATAERNGRGEARPVPVELAPVERGPIERRRTFTGTLEPRAELVVAPKIAGRIEALTVDLADQVARGQVVATLDSDEYRQTVEQARAEVAVARANLAEAESLLTIAERELTRVDQLRERGVTSESQRDLAKAEQLAKQAHLAVSRAQLTRAEAALAGASIRLGYTEVAATWRGEGGERVVAERHVEEGETVAANEPLFRIVELDPILAVFHVTERDYALLEPGQPAELRTDAWPGEVFQGRVARIAPVFREASRQARVELKVDNPELRLKPGMFVRATLVLERIPDALIVPEPALTTRDGQRGVFVLGADGKRVDWRPVEVGIRQGDRVQVLGEELSGQVVTLGQQLLDDGSLVRLPEPAQAAAR